MMPELMNVGVLVSSEILSFYFGSKPFCLYYCCRVDVGCTIDVLGYDLFSHFFDKSFSTYPFQQTHPPELSLIWFSSHFLTQTLLACITSYPISHKHSPVFESLLLFDPHFAKHLSFTLSRSFRHWHWPLTNIIPLIGHYCFMFVFASVSEFVTLIGEGCLASVFGLHLVPKSVIVCYFLHTQIFMSELYSMFTSDRHFVHIRPD